MEKLNNNSIYKTKSYTYTMSYFAQIMQEKQEFQAAYNTLKKRDLLELIEAINTDCDAIIEGYKDDTVLDHGERNNKSNVTYVKHCLSPDEIDYSGEEVNYDWNELRKWAEHLFINKFFCDQPTDAIFRFTRTETKWSELTGLWERLLR